MRRCWSLLVGVGVLVLLVAPSPAASAPIERPVSLLLEPELRVGNLTFFVGALQVNDTAFQDPVLVGTDRFVLPPGDIVACPVDTSTAGLIPTLQALEGDCRGGTRHPDAQVHFGARTWLQLAGNYRMEAWPNATLSAFVGSADRDSGRPLWLSLASPASYTVQFAADELRFAAIRAIGEVIVESEGEQTRYNGTTTAFQFTGSGPADLRAAGAAFRLDDAFGVSLSPGDLAGIPHVMAPRLLLDLQDALLGTDAREPVRNASDQFRLSRNPTLLNGAVVGTLNGTVGARDLSREPVAHVRFDRLDGRVTGDAFEGQGPVVFVLTDSTLSQGAGSAGAAPWWAFACLWAVAAVAWAVGRPWRPLGYPWRLLDWVLPAAVFALWDLVVLAWLGTSGMAGLVQGAPAHVWMRLLAFELVAFALAWVLLYVPVRTLGRRLLPSRLGWVATPLAAALLAIYVWLAAGRVFSMGLALATL